MDEWYPDDVALLEREADEETGVEYIRTGQSPYYLEFRRMLHRLLEAARRANDLRVYQDGELTIGVRGGRCVLKGGSVAFGGTSGVSLENNATTHVWLDEGGEVQTGPTLPADRTMFVPLAKVTAEAGAITAMEDLRGEAFLAVPSLAGLGVSASAEAVNTALADADATVTATALNTLTGGQQSLGDAYHQHSQMLRSADGVEQFTLVNTNSGGAANVALGFDVPAHLATVTLLHPHVDDGWLRQSVGGQTRTLLGAVQVSHTHEGELTSTQSGKLMGVAPVAGRVTAVVLSAGANLESSESADAVEAVAKVNGSTLTDTHPQLTAGDGTGFRCTDQGDGNESQIKSDGTEQVQRGDVITVDLVRSASGSVVAEASDVVAMVVIRADRPE